MYQVDVYDGPQQKDPTLSYEATADDLCELYPGTNLESDLRNQPATWDGGIIIKNWEGKVKLVILKLKRID